MFGLTAIIAGTVTLTVGYQDDGTLRHGRAPVGWRIVGYTAMVGGFWWTGTGVKSQVSQLVPRLPLPVDGWISERTAQSRDRPPTGSGAAGK